MKTIFEKIIDGEIPSARVYEDELCVAFRDVNPQAPTHILLVPRKAIPRIAEAADSDQALLGHLLLTVKKIASQENLSKGFRVVINNGSDGGETVPHLHIHILANRPLSWPPG